MHKTSHNFLNFFRIINFFQSAYFFQNLYFFKIFLKVSRNVFKIFWNFLGHFINFLVRKEFLHFFKISSWFFKFSQNFLEPLNFVNVCLEFSQDFSNLGNLFLQSTGRYPKSPHIFPKQFLKSNKVEVLCMYIYKY